MTATLRIVTSSDGRTYTYPCASIVSGTVAAVQSVQLEPLTARGVDGKRWRAVRKAREPIVFRVCRPIASGEKYSTAETEMARISGQLATVTYTNNTQVVRMVSAVIVSATVEARTGQMYGSGEVSGSTQTVIATMVVDTTGDFV